jgi:hypothetical protein
MLGGALLSVCGDGLEGLLLRLLLLLLLRGEQAVADCGDLACGR